MSAATEHPCIQRWNSKLPITGPEIQECLAAARLSNRQVAMMLGLNEMRIRMWIEKPHLVPADASKWFRKLGAGHAMVDAENPPPAVE